MAKKAKRFISSLLALTMMVSSFAMTNVSSVFASGNTIDVWDFGGSRRIRHITLHKSYYKDYS